MAEELGDDDEVGAAAHEGGREGVPQDVDGRVVVEAGGRGDRGDDVVGAPDAETLPALVEVCPRRATGVSVRCPFPPRRSHSSTALGLVYWRRRICSLPLRRREQKRASVSAHAWSSSAAGIR